MDAPEFKNVTVKIEPEQTEYSNFSEIFSSDNQLLNCKIVVDNIKEETEEHLSKSSLITDLKVMDVKTESCTGEVLKSGGEQQMLRYEVEHVANKSDGTNFSGNPSESCCKPRRAYFPICQEVKIEDSIKVSNETEGMCAKNRVMSQIPQHVYQSEMVPANSNFENPKEGRCNVRRIICELCGKEFSTKSHLTRHERIHSGVKPYKCEVCLKCFSQNSHLICHERIHSGIRPYKCGVCSKAFVEKSTLNKHERMHTGVKPYKCEVCFKAFAQNSILTYHRRIHSGFQPYKCEVCSKTFIEKASLNKHERIHTGVKPYNCEICSKAFAQKSILTYHERVHSGVKPYKCDICSKAFTRKTHLTSHKIIHSDVQSYKVKSVEGHLIERHT